MWFTSCCPRGPLTGKAPLNIDLKNISLINHLHVPKQIEVYLSGMDGNGMGLKCRKSSFRKKTRKRPFFPSLASIAASSRPLHLSHIRHFLWRFHWHLTFFEHCRCWRLQLGWGGGSVFFSVITYHIPFLLRRHKGKGAPTGIAGPLELILLQQ